jgi:hypothetical protein
VRFRWWSAVLAATVLGAGIGAAVAAAGDVDHTAEAKVVVQAKGGASVVPPLLPSVRELATSSILAGNVDSTLRLPGSADALRRRLRATIAPGSQVIVLSVTDGERDRARQIAQEAAVVLTQLVQARFRTPPLRAAVLDPAHVVRDRGRHFARDTLVGAAVGLVAALAALVLRRGLPVARAPTDEKLAARERALRERIDLVTKRERELAKRAGEVAKRERAVAAIAAHKPAPAEAPPPLAPPVPPPEPTPARAPSPRLLDGSGSLPTLGELELLVEARRADSPERVQEWTDYLFYLREHAGPDGRLPSHFSGLLQDVFGDLFE